MGVAHGNASISQSSTYSKFGSNSLKVISGDTGANGVRFPVSVSSSTTYSMGVWVYSPDSGNMDIAIWRNDFGAYVGSSAVNVPANTWTHISGTGTTDGVSPWSTLLVRNLNGATRTFYVDGKASGNSSSMSPNIGTGNTPVIGSGMGGNAGGWRFNGQIDDLRVYNYALTASQIKQVMNQGAGVRFGPLTGTP